MASTTLGALSSRLQMDDGVTAVAVVAGVTVLVDTVGRWALSAGVGVDVRPLALLVVLATVTVGVTARYGLAVGLLGSGLLLSDWTGGVTSAIAAFAAAVVCGRLWHDRGEATGWLRWLARYEVAAVLSTVALAATSAWVSDVLGVTAFSTAVVQSLTANLALAVLGAPGAWVLIEFGSGRNWRTPSEELSTVARLLVAGVLVAWAGGGYLGSFLFQAVSLIPIELFGRRLGSTAETIVTLGGPQGRYAVFLLGVVAIGALFVVFRHE